MIGLVLLLAGGSARADGDLANFLIGPVLGVRLGGPPGDRGIIGFEGGAGYGPERLNAGFEHRLDKDFVYVEIDPWYLLGGTLGFGIDTDGKQYPVLGVWEGIPLSLGRESCSDWNRTITLAGGYRYTGVHELYATLKAGWMRGSVCFD